MARMDEKTLKRPMSGNSRSHALNATKRKFNLNLQKVKVLVGKRVTTIKVTAKTAKTLKKKGQIAS